jgi:hypothetical protein
VNDRDPGYGDWPPRAEWDEGGSSVFGGRGRRDDGRPHTSANGRRGAGYDDPWSGGGYPSAAGQRYDDPRTSDPWPGVAADDAWPHEMAGNGGYGDRWGPGSGPGDPGGQTGYQGATTPSSGYDRRWQQSGYVQPWEQGRAPTPRRDPRPTSPYGSPPAGDRPRRGPPPGGRPAREPDRDRDGRGFPLGLGALFGVVGLACFLAGLIVLPWFEVAGEGVTLADIRSSFTPPETDPEDLGIASGTPTTLPDGIPTPDEVTDVVEQEVREQAAEAAAGAVDSGKSRYLKLYANTLWMAVAGGAVAAVLFSTILAPRSAAMSLVVGLRRLSGLVIVLAAAAHGAALWVVFSGDGPSPALGVWLGVGGLVAVFAGCILGPKR